MQAFIEEFGSHYPLDPPPGCTDAELYFAIKISQICREDAFSEEHPFHRLGRSARNWLLRAEMKERLYEATVCACPEMRRVCLSVYLFHQFPGFLSVASAAVSDEDWGVRAAVCEAFHDLGLHSADLPNEAIVQARRFLVHLACNDRRYIVRSRAAESLRYYPSAEVLRDLRAIAENDHEVNEEFMVESAAAMAEESIRHINETANRGV